MHTPWIKQQILYTQSKAPATPLPDQPPTAHLHDRVHAQDRALRRVDDGRPEQAPVDAAVGDGEGAARHLVDGEAAVAGFAAQLRNGLGGCTVGWMGGGVGGSVAGHGGSGGVAGGHSTAQPSTQHTQTIKLEHREGAPPPTATHPLHLCKVLFVRGAQHRHHQALGGGDRDGDVYIVAVDDVGACVCVCVCVCVCGGWRGGDGARGGMAVWGKQAS